MSLTVYYTSLEPYKNGYRTIGYGDDEVLYLAFRRDNKLLWFAGTVDKPPRLSHVRQGVYEWSFGPSVRFHKILTRLDTEVALIDEGEFERLRLLESERFWPAYFTYLRGLIIRRLRIWLWYRHPHGLIPKPTEAMEKRASDYAHRLVQESEGMRDGIFDWVINEQGQAVMIDDKPGYDDSEEDFYIDVADSLPELHNDLDDEFHKVARRRAKAVNIAFVDAEVQAGKQPPDLEFFRRGGDDGSFPAVRRRTIDYLRADGTAERMVVQDYERDRFNVGSDDDNDDDRDSDSNDDGDGGQGGGGGGGGVGESSGQGQGSGTGGGGAGGDDDDDDEFGGLYA